MFGCWLFPLLFLEVAFCFVRLNEEEGFIRGEECAGLTKPEIFVGVGGFIICGCCSKPVFYALPFGDCVVEN